MIGVFVKIAFHNQLKRSDPDLAGKVAAAVAEASSRFEASILPSEESYFLYFNEDEGCSRLRAAETARFLESRISPLSPRLHGWNILLDSAGKGDGGARETGAEELFRSLRRSWYQVAGDGFSAGYETLEGFADYLEAGDAWEGKGSMGFPYARDALPAACPVPEASGASRERFIDETGKHGIGESGAELLLAVGPGSAPSDFLKTAFETLYKDEAGSFLWLHAGVGNHAPYGPFIRALSRPLEERELEGFSEADRASLMELGEVARFIASSPYRQGYSEAIRTRMRLYLAARLALYARNCAKSGLPAIVVFEGLDLFPEASLELIRELLDLRDRRTWSEVRKGESRLESRASEILGAEGLVFYGTASRTPRDFDPARLRIVAAPPPSPAAMAQAALAASKALGREGLGPRLASLAEGDPFRLLLCLRLAAEGLLPAVATGTGDLAALVLSSFPPEFPDFILAHALAEDVLDEGCLDDFLHAAGFVQGIRPLLYGQLSSLGFLSGDCRHRLLRPELVEAARKAACGGGERLLDVFSERLLSFHAEGRIKPSEALFDRISERSLPGEKRKLDLFYLDCEASDALYGPSRSVAVAETPLIAGISAFRASYATANQAASGEALAGLEEAAKAASGGGEGGLAQALASLSRAFDEYARGLPAQAANRTRPALIGLHGYGARRTEARAHRLLGLCSLAQNQVPEGISYLSNARELAGEVPDSLECILSGYAEAGALLVIGDLGHARQRMEKTSAIARSCFRVDWEAACDFLSGRLAFELGRYEEADAAFGRVRAMARVYGQSEVASRAEIWSGRTAAYAGRTGQARELLGRKAEDPEAEWFLAELAWFEGSPSEAASRAGRAKACLGPRGYGSADAASWASGFDCLEGKSLGFSGGRSYLADQIEAFAEFMDALSGRNPEALLGLARRTREERLADIHPSVHLYHYYCYLVLASCGGPLDASTVLGKSFKALQTRSSRMEETGLKGEYLERNRWNQAIMAEARKHKLI